LAGVGKIIREVGVTNIDNVSAAWAAGVFEGEGTCDKNGTVFVTQKDPWLPESRNWIFGPEQAIRRETDSGSDDHKP
jgi:hypothetical protein